MNGNKGEVTDIMTWLPWYKEKEDLDLKENEFAIRINPGDVFHSNKGK